MDACSSGVQRHSAVEMSTVQTRACCCYHAVCQSDVASADQTSTAYARTVGQYTAPSFHTPVYRFQLGGDPPTITNIRVVKQEGEANYSDDDLIYVGPAHPLRLFGATRRRLSASGVCGKTASSPCLSSTSLLE